LVHWSSSRNSSAAATGVEPDAWRSLYASRAAAVAESNRLRVERRRDHGSRRRVFEQIRRINGDLLQLRPDIESDAATALAEARRRLEHNRVAMGREWFYGLYPTVTLTQLAETLTAGV
ncbi:MAG: hypothetical protein V3T70_11410, partial [Phycisphaerae bacterium]